MNPICKTAAAVLVALTLFAVRQLRAEEFMISVKANQVVGRVPRHLTGACIEDVNHEIYGGIYSQMIFGESFQEPLPSPSIAGFKTLGGLWTVNDDVLRLDATDGPKLVSDRDAFKNGQVGVELLFADRKGQNAGLIVRVEKPGIGADNFIGYEVALEPMRQMLRLARHRNNYEPIKDVKCDVAIGRWIPLEVKLEGSTIEIFVDGKSVLRHDDGDKALLTGGVGLRGWHCQASFRHFRVKTGAANESLSFKQNAQLPEISRMWKAVRSGAAVGRFGIVTDRPFAGSQSQQVAFISGDGRWGIENQGLNRWGMSFVEGQPYEGYFWARAEKPATVFAALESRDGARSYAEAKLEITDKKWQRLDFTLKPNAADKAGRFVLSLKAPGSVVFGHAFLQPGAWGRFQGLPVRRDVAEGLIDQGITILRYGGSMVNNDGYKWKKMIGPRDRRPPYAGTWYPYSTNGWGIVDFMDFCEAAGFEYIPDFNMNESPADLADFIEYAKGSADSEWGRKRVADGRKQPYRLRYVEIGNEERVDEKYAVKFESIAKAVWAKDPEIILVVGDFAYDRRIDDPFKLSGAASGITSLAGQKRILQLAKEHNREVWFDAHVWTDRPVKVNSSLDGMFSFTDALTKLAGGAKHKVAVFEFNSGNHAQKRALANALALNAVERDGRIPIVTSANGLQPDGQNDNDWDQGLLFLNPSKVWLQPPGYVTRMISRNFLPNLVKCEVTDKESKLDVVAKVSDDGKTLILQVVNVNDKAVASAIEISAFVPSKAVAEATTLAGPLDGVNRADKADAVIPVKNEWKHVMREGRTSYTFAPNSLTLLRFE